MSFDASDFGRPNHPEVLMDLLPREVSTRILMHMTHGKHTEHALQLAEVSRAQHEIVSAALSHRFIADPFDPLLEAWNQLFGGRLRHLVVAEVAYTFDPRRDSALYSLLMGPHLRQLCVTGSDERILSPLSAAPWVKVLRFEMRLVTDIWDFIDAVAGMKLEELTLECAEVNYNACPFRRFVEIESARRKIASALRGLRSLDLKCESPGHDARVLAYYIPLIPTLEDVTVRAVPTPPAVEFMERLSSVRILLPPRAHDLAMRLGERVRELAIVERLDREQVLQIGECPRLEKLDICLREEANEVVADVVKSLRELKSLWLSWKPEESSLFHEVEGIQGEVEAHVDAARLYEIVQNAPGLEDLAVRYVNVTMDGLEKALGEVRCRLRSLAVSIVGQEEMPAQRLLLVLLAISKYNRNLKAFNSGERVPENVVVGSNEEIVELARKIRVALGRAQCTTPTLENGFVQRVLKRLDRMVAETS